jgi:hypothetical protein
VSSNLTVSVEGSVFVVIYIKGGSRTKDTDIKVITLFDETTVRDFLTTMRPKAFAVYHNVYAEGQLVSTRWSFKNPAYT